MVGCRDHSSPRESPGLHSWKRCWAGRLATGRPGSLVLPMTHEREDPSYAAPGGTTEGGDCGLYLVESSIACDLFRSWRRVHAFGMNVVYHNRRPAPTSTRSGACATSSPPPPKLSFRPPRPAPLAAEILSYANPRDNGSTGALPSIAGGCSSFNINK